MTDEELKKLEEEVAALEKTVAKKTGRPLPSGASKRTRKPKAQPTSNAKRDMPQRGTVEWEAWQASKLQQSNAEGNTLLMQLKVTLDKQMRRLNKLHIGDQASYIAQGRAEGLACAIGMLRGSSMTAELKFAQDRIKPRGEE